jgi:hypothetical protein
MRGSINGIDFLPSYSGHVVAPYLRSIHSATATERVEHRQVRQLVWRPSCAGCLKLITADMRNTSLSNPRLQQNG